MWILLFLVALIKGGTNRPGTGSFNTLQQLETKARQGSNTSPAAIPPVRPGKSAVSPTSLVDGDDEAVDKLVKRISEAEMRVYIKALFFQMYKSPPREQWSGMDGVCTKIATNLCCSAQTVLQVITRLASDDLDVAVCADGSGSHNKNIRLGTTADYKKKLENLFKEKCDTKTSQKGGKSAWADYYGNNSYQERYGDDWYQHLPKTFKWHYVRYYNIK